MSYMYLFMLFYFILYNYTSKIQNQFCSKLSIQHELTTISYTLLYPNINQIIFDSIM